MSCSIHHNAKAWFGRSEPYLVCHIAAVFCFSFPGFWSLVWSFFFVEGFGIRVNFCHAPYTIMIRLLIRLGHSEPYLVCHLAPVLCFFFPGFWSLVWSFFVRGFGIRVNCCRAEMLHLS